MILALLIVAMLLGAFNGFFVAWVGIASFVADARRCCSSSTA